MTDRHSPRPRVVNSLTAAARILRPVRQDAPKAMPWHDEAWTMRDQVGELRFAEMWLSNAFSRSRIFAARRPEPGKEPEPVESGPAHDLVARLAGGVAGQAGLLRAFGSYMLVPGLAYLVGEPQGDVEKFEVVDAENLRLGQAADADVRQYEIREDETIAGWRRLSVGTAVTKVWRQHPRRRWEPDSPTRAALPILHELVLLTQHVEASAVSRLAGAGMQAFPAEADFPGGWDKFIKDWVAAMANPVKDRNLAGALTPFPIKMPGDLIPNFKEGYITYATPFDDKSIELREEAITRLGNAMDMPRQVLTGEQKNHWGDWQTEESGLKMHVEPGLETICEGITVGYLNPGLEAASDGDQASRLALEEIESETPNGEWLVWYDTSDLRVRPDRGTATQEAYDRYEVDGDALRKELGITEAQPPDPADEETARRVWFSLLGGDHTALALEKLGLATADEIQAANPPPPQLVAPPGAPEATPEDQPSGERTGTPQTQEKGAPAEPAAVPVQAAGAVPDYPPDVTPGVAIVAALDGVVHRAMERAGRRALNRMPRRNGNLDTNCPAVRLHTCTRIDRLEPMDGLFAGAWVRVPEIAERLGEDAEALTATVDRYCRALVVAMAEHSWERLSEALGVCPCEAG